MCAIILDNYTINDTVIRRIQNYFCYEILLSGQYSHIRYYTYILNIIVQDGMKIIHEAIEYIREIARYISANPSRMQAFNEIA